MDYATMFDQVSKLLGVKENESLRDVMLPMVKKIYYLPDETHITLMMKQFMIYEPVSLAIYALFTTIKKHFEHLVERFIELRNMYINKYKISVKTNDWPARVAEWNDLNVRYRLESSSVILLFLNPPKKLKSGIHYKISPEFEQLITNLKNSIHEFHYGGFCPKVPTERLSKLLTFPLNEFVAIIQALSASLNIEEKLPNYEQAETAITKIFADKPALPKIPNELQRKEPPVISDQLKLIQWYVDNIFNLRKQLLTYGRLYENYYITLAHSINAVNDKLVGLGF
jgi:hypothetical protein